MSVKRTYFIQDKTKQRSVINEMDYTRIQCHTKPDMEKVFNGCSDPEFAFSNVPQKSVNVLENFERSLRVHYPQRIIFHEKHS